MICLKISLSRFSICYVKILFEELNMPKYAVAVGRKVGIYDTYDECKLQVINYPKAKFKKFDRVEDAEDFIRKFSNFPSSKAGTTANLVGPMVQVTTETLNPPELIKVEKISPKSDLFSLTNRVSSVEGRLEKFISDTTNLLENIVSRLNDLESKVNCFIDSYPVKEPPLKKRRTDCGPTVDCLATNDSGFVEVYTDGACSNNGRSGAKAGIGVWFNDDHPLNISAPVQGLATNNNAEIQAARVAITQAHRARVKKLKIYTDSKFVISCITEWIKKWKKNNWMLSSGGPVKNKDELVKLDNAIQFLEAVEWSYVAGHKGIRGNEMADRLAREGALKYKPNITYGMNASLCNAKLYEPPDGVSSSE